MVLTMGGGDVAKGTPQKLYMVLRKKKRPQKQQVKAIAKDLVKWEKDTWQHIAAVWRINTGARDGAMLLYVNGKRVARRTDFKAYQITFGTYLWIVPDAVVDEMNVWDRMLTDEEVKSLFESGKPAEK